MAVELFDHLEQGADGAGVAEFERAIDRPKGLVEPFDLEAKVAVDPVEPALVERAVDLAPDRLEADTRALASCFSRFESGGLALGMARGSTEGDEA